MRYISDFFKERVPRCPDVENAENEDSERKPSLQIADTDRNHYSFSRPAWAWPLTCESTGCCSATYCTLALTWHHSFPQDNAPISHTERESEWMHELTLNIRFYTSLQSVFIPSFVLCTLKIAWHLMNHEGLYCIRAQRLTSPRGTGRFHDNLKTTGWHLFTRRTSAVGSDSFGMGKKVNYCKPSENRNSCFPE